MPEVNTYEDMTVEVMQSTPYPGEVVATALGITMNSDPEKLPPVFTDNLGKYILDADHGSVLEHVIYTFMLQGVSRSFLAQITRHRICSFTSGSQHYQNYQSYPCSVHPDVNKNEITKNIMYNALECAYASYTSLIENGVPHEEARQCLPNAATVNILWTINARSLANFLYLRLCNRNTREIQIQAERVLEAVTNHFPELFKHVGPQCYLLGKCKQGKMKCSKGIWK